VKYRLVTPTYKRPHRIVKHPLLEHLHVLIDREQVSEYREAFDRAGRWPLEIVEHSEKGLPATRNAGMELFTPDLDFLFMTDDDIDGVWTTATKEFTDDPSMMLALLEQLARMALDSGVWMFGYPPQPMYLLATSVPFSWRHFVSGHACGYTRKLEFDLNITSVDDRDMFLQCIEGARIVLRDNRYYWVHDQKTEGGLKEVRDAAGEPYKPFVDLLRAKWGPAVVRPGVDHWGLHI